jgi:hypothetical protein
VQSVSIQPCLEVDEGVPGVTGSRLVDCGPLIMDDCTALQGYIDGSFTRCIPSRNEAKVEPLAANIFVALIKERFPMFVVTGDLKASDFRSARREWGYRERKVNLRKAVSTERSPTVLEFVENRWGGRG